MKRIAVKTFILIMLAALIPAACTTTSSVKEEDTPVQMANPFRTYKEIESAEETAGFELSVPEQIAKNYSATVYRAISGKMIEVIYKNASLTDEIRIRKAAGNEDISGDYNTYDEDMTIIINGLQVESRGNAGKTQAATWQDGNYSYSITSDEGLSLSSLKKIVEQVQ